MNDSAAVTAANLIRQHAISQGSGVILFAATFADVLASALRIAHAAGRIEGLMTAQAHVQDAIRRVG